LINFLDSGRGVYIEGANFGSQNEGTPIYDKFGCALAGVGDIYDIGNIETVSGEPGTLADGLDFNYMYQQPPDNLLDNIEANGGTLFFKSQDGLGRGVNYSGPSNNYRTIHATFIFGALINGIHTKYDLMQSYMNFLTGAAGVVEYEADLEPAFSFSVSPNPFSKLTNISFGIEHSAQSIELTIFDVTGRLVKSFGSLPSAPGPMQIRWDGTDNLGRRVSSGSYIVRIETDQEIVNKAVVLVN
jgi:hypothetical protein